MDPNTLITFGIPALVAGVWIYRRVRPVGRARANEGRDPSKITQDVAAATESAPLSTRTWLDYVNVQPDSVPHLAVIGPSGAGKTTTTTAVLHDRPGQIVIITAKEGDHWGGLPYIGIDDDATYTSACAAFVALLAEVKQRLVDTKHQRLTADWLTIVVDDFSTLVGECPVAADVVKLVARLGRSLRVRLIMLSDSALVKSIGLEGEGETRRNFAFMRLTRERKGTIEIDDQHIPIDLSMVKRISEAAQLGGRAWRPARPERDELADLLAVRPSAGAETAQNDADGRTDGRTDDTPEPKRDALIRHLKAEELGRDAIRSALTAAGFKISSKRLSELMNE